MRRKAVAGNVGKKGIPTVSPIIPSSPNYTPASNDFSPASNTEFDPSEDPSSDHKPSLPATSPFLSSINDSSDSNTLDKPASPTYDTLFTEITLSTQRSPAASGALHHRVMIITPGQPIPHGRPYRYHPNGSVHMMTAMKKVGLLPNYHLTVRHSVNYSSSDPFTSDDSSETSLDSSLDDLSDSSSGHSSSDHSSPVLPLATGQQSSVMSKRIDELEQDNMRLRGTLDVVSQRVSRLQCRKLRVERFIRGLPNNIQRNVIAAQPTRLQDAIRVANNLMDKKLKGYARNAKNKRRFDNNPRDNRAQQPAFKRQKVRGQNLARAYTTGSNERKGNYKRVGHMTKDCTASVAPNTQRTPIGNQPGIVCYECEKQRYFRKDCLKLRN
nr:hypothetical protein [Tanacetum cinerariifolium]